MNVGIAGIGAYLPEHIMTNADMEKMVDTSDEWISSRTGIRERRIAAIGETTASMGAKAAVAALKDAGIEAEDVDILIGATITADKQFPSMACAVQAEIGAVKAFAFDINAACSGFLYSLEMARGAISCGTAKNVLVVCAERFSKILDWTDRDTCVLFGDGAGAAVVHQLEEGRGILSSSLQSDGRLGDMLTAIGGSDGHPDVKEQGPIKPTRISMNGREVFKHAVRCMHESSLTAIERAGLSPEEIDVVIPHQANARIIQAVMSRMDVPDEKLFLNLDRVGNVSAASVPVAAVDAVKAGRLKKGDVVLVSVAGAGFTWGAAVIEW